MKKVELIKNVDQKLAREWEFLWENSDTAHFFNSYKWFQVCQEVFPDAKYSILCVRDNESLEAVMPLVVSRKIGVKFLTNPGGKYIDRSALLVKKQDKAIIKCLVTKLKTKGSFLLPEVQSQLADLFVGQQLTKVTSGINLQLPFEDNPFRFVKAKNKRKITKIHEEYGKDLKFVMNRGNSATLKLAMNIDGISYRQKKNIGTFNNLIDRKFFTSLSRIAMQDTGINILYYKKKPVAYEIGIRAGKTYHGLNKSFDNRYAFLTPGKILAHYLFDGLHKEGIELFDFSRGDDMLKRSFTDITKMQYDIYYTDNLLARIALVGTSSLRKKLVENKLFYSTYRKLRSIKK
jgi:CelD/BcsL family acetyltransferase involved in cellulose biosynthesis